MASYQKESQGVKLRFKPQSGWLMDQVREVLRYHHYAILSKSFMLSGYSHLFDLVTRGMLMLKQRKYIRMCCNKILTKW